MSEWTELRKKYEQYLELNYIKSQADPDEEPYRTKYEARKLIESLIQSFNPTDSEFLKAGEDGDDVYNKYFERLNPVCREKFKKSAKEHLVLQLLQFQLAKNYIETEEVETGERLVRQIARELDDIKLVDENNKQSYLYDPLVFNLKLSCLNEMVFVWSHRSYYKESLKLIQSVEELYTIYEANQSLSPHPYLPIELIHPNTASSSVDLKRRTNFESLYTHSLFFFAQIYAKLGEREKSAYYCQLTLQRQLDGLNSEEDTVEKQAEVKTSIEQLDERVLFNELEWATHAAALSQYYLTESDFATCRYCLCCADAILVKLNSVEEKTEKLKEQTASIRRCWGKYAIELLKYSKERLVNKFKESKSDNIVIDAEEKLDLPSRFQFSLPENIYKVKEIEKNAITSNPAVNFEQAREIFLKGQAVLNETKSYFKLDGFVSDHCEIVRDLSELFAALLFFESDADRRCKMQKRRLDLLIPICDDISEQHYLQAKRQLLFDIASIYHDLMDIKSEIYLEKKEKPELKDSKELAAAALKINQLANSSIQRFEEFLTTMKVQPERLELPKRLDEHNVRSVLLAKFYTGRLYSKIITSEPSKKLINTKHSYENYKYLVDYCEREKKEHQNDQPMESMKTEFDICKEMVLFLPAQMDKLRAMIS